MQSKEGLGALTGLGAAILEAFVTKRPRRLERLNGLCRDEEFPDKLEPNPLAVQPKSTPRVESFTATLQELPNQ